MKETGSIAISCRGVQKHFGVRVQALRGVDFEARLGELTFIVGPSGCGKTTLLSVITGLLDPSKGEVELFGSNAGRLPADQRILFRRPRLRCVVDEIVSEELVENIEVSPPLDLFGVSADDGFSRFRRSDAAHIMISPRSFRP